MKRKFIVVITFVLICVMAFSSCNSTNVDEPDTLPQNATDTTVQAGNIILPYSKSDSLNPFFATGLENSALAFLYCQPLFTVKNDYSPQAVVADTFNTSGKTVTVTIKSVKYSDSSQLKLKDIVYSFNLAKNSTGYSQRLSNVESATVKGNAVEFTLKKPDAFVFNILTFPIVKEGTANTANDIPVGSGQFVFSDDETMALSSNSQGESSITSIKLNDIKKLDYITNELEIGNINYLFENFSDGNYKRIVAENKAVTLNNFVFVGMNSSYGALASSAIRTAIYYAVDKQTVSASSFQGYALASSLPFNPDFYELDNVNIPDVKGDKNKSISILEKTGYNRYTKTGIRTNGTNVLQFSILVNSQNIFRLAAAYKICDNLNEIGFQASVEAVDSNVYQQRISSGNFQMYIGEVKLTENMDLSVFSQGIAGAGINKTDKFFTDYDSFREGTIGMQEIANSFMDSVFVVPLCYRAGMAAYSKAYTPDFSCAPFDIYANMQNWYKSK